MDVLLIYPRFDYPTFGEPQEPLGLLYVGAALEAAGHDVRLIDLTVSDPSDIDEALGTAHMAGISSSSALYGRACTVLERIKAQRPGLPVVLGGPHATVLAADAVERGFDAAVIGEGEAAAVEIAEAVEQGRALHTVPGVAAFVDGRVERGPARPFIPDLDALPDPDRGLVDYIKYFDMGLTRAGLMASRGCPWRCSFCKPMQDKLFGRRIRRRSQHRIVAEMKAIRDSMGRSAFLFRDDTMALAGIEWFRAFEREFQALGLSGLSWSCQARVDQVEAPLLEQMKRCGLEGVAFGVESGSQKVLDFYRKGIKVDQTIRAFDLCRELGIGTHAFIMLGAPVETREDLEQTVSLVERIRPNSVSVSITTPAPGTDLYEQTRAMGIYNIEDPEDTDYQFNLQPMRLPHLKTHDIARAQRAILELVPGTYFKDQLQERFQFLDTKEAGA